MKTSVAECWERAVCIMRYIDKRSPQGGGTKVSKAQLVRDLHYSPSQVDYTIKHLMSDEYVTVKPRIAKHGGTLCNAYSLTKKGKAVLMSLTEKVDKSTS